MPPLIVNSTLQVGSAILTEANLSFLGWGDRNLVSWGWMLHNAQPFLTSAWWMSLAPGLALTLSILGINLLGDALNAAWNLRLEARRTPHGRSARANI